MIKRQDSDTQSSPTENFTHYVAYNEYGGVEKRIPREDMENWLHDWEAYGHRALSIWEFARMNEMGINWKDKAGAAVAICVRLSPVFELDGRDNQWQSWKYTFVPEGHGDVK